MEELTHFWASLEFDYPLYFWIGGLSILLLIFMPRLTRRKGLLIDLDYWEPQISGRSKRIRVFSIIVAVVSILLAAILVNPKIVYKNSSLVIGKPVILVVDVSGSTLQANDLHPEMTGQEAASQAFYNLIALRADINFGLMIYARDNYVARYFTYKNDLFKDTMENKEELNRIAHDTLTAEAMATARQFLVDNIKGEDKSVVLISDLDYGPIAFAELKDEIEKELSLGIKVFVVSTTGDAKGMAQFSNMQGLKVTHIFDQHSIGQMYAQLSAMQTSPIRLDESLSRTSFIPFLMAPVLVAMLVCLVLGETLFRKIP